MVIDSLDSAAEGVGEQDSAKPSRAIAAVLDIARRDGGPAILLLGNTVRSGAHSRGSGVIEDRADIVYEVRDATNLKPAGNRPWIEELPAADAGSWAARASRRNQRSRFRLAFVVTKYRIGEEPEPFILEVDLSTEPWDLRDVTDEVDHAGAEARAQRDQEKRERLETAASELAREVQARAADPLLKGDAEELLMKHDLTRKVARELIAQRDGTAWRLEKLPERGHPVALLPPKVIADDGGGNQEPASPIGTGICEMPISAAQAGRARRESDPANPLENKGLGGQSFSAVEEWGEV